MTPATIIQEAKKDGVILALSNAGTIKATGGGAAVHRWLAAIREHKAAIIDVLKVGAGDTASLPGQPVITGKEQAFDPEAWEERAAICEFDGGLTREEAESLAWQEDDRRRCSQCGNLSNIGVCRIAEPKAGALVIANRGYRPVQDIPGRCRGFMPGRNCGRTSK